MGWYIVCWMRMFNYTGKSSRMEYWYFVGLSLVILSFLGLLLIQFAWAKNYLYAVMGLNLLPYMAVLVRRIRDAGYSPWHAGWRFVPVIGQAMLLYITTRSSCKDPAGRFICPRKSSDAAPLCPLHD